MSLWVFGLMIQMIRVPFNSKGNEARIVNKRLRLSALNSLHVTLTDNRNGLRNLNPYPKTIFIARGQRTIKNDFHEMSIETG